MTVPAGPKPATHAHRAGPILFLSADASVMAAQLARYPYIGLRVGGGQPV